MCVCVQTPTCRQMARKVRERRAVCVCLCVCVCVCVCVQAVCSAALLNAHMVAAPVEPSFDDLKGILKAAGL